MRYLPLIGRVLLCLLFLISGLTFHFTSNAVQYAEAQGVPAASLLVPLSGVIAIVGALSIMLGYRAKWGAWLLVIFLIPVTFMMHNFWAIDDPMQRQMQMTMFMKNLGLLGGVLLVAYWGAGPISLDSRQQ
jgi:putative oxidoreductase